MSDHRGVPLRSAPEARLRAVAGIVATVAVAATVGALTATSVPRAGLVAPVLTVGLLAVGSLVLAASRASGPSRPGWGLVAASTVLLVLALLGPVLGWSDVLVWAVLRGSAFGLALVAVLLSVGPRRGLRSWLLLVLDGSVVGLSTFLVFWVLLRSSPAADGTLEAVHPALLWLPFDLAVASLVTGRCIRSATRFTVGATLVVIAAVGAAASDAAWVLTGDQESWTGGWLAVLVLLTVAGRLGGDLWSPAGRDVSPSGPGRLSQIFCVPALALAIAVRPDDVTVSATAVLLVALALQVAVVHRQNAALWTAVARQARELDDLLVDSRDALLQLDGDGVVVFASDAVQDVFGVRPPQMIGHRLSAWAHPEDDLLGADAVTPLVEGRVRRVLVRGRVLHADGGWRHTESVISLRDGGSTAGWTLSCRDTTEAEALAAEVRRQARTDSLTGLLSRAAFLAAVDARLADGPAAVLFVDLDRFKGVNDTAGHAVGDRLLQDVAAAIEGSVGPHDVVARLGGDEFAVLGAEGTRAGGLALAEQVLGGLRAAGRDRPGVVGPTSASIGVAVATGGGAEALLGEADLAMYAAKAAGGGRAVPYEPRMRTQVLERARLVAELDTALADGTGLGLHLQPVVDLRDGRWTGYEALVRWDAVGGLRQPAAFVPLAEETGQIVPLGAWVLHRALDWLATSEDPTAGVSVNVASRQLAEPGFARTVLEALEASGVTPSRLTLEVTEQTAIDDLTRTGARLQDLRAHGVHVSLDDFGTGFSSLGYLAQLPVDELKIDRRFVAGLGVRSADDALVRAVLRLADDLGLSVVAEGVETAEQAASLADLGCPRAQGWYFRRPAPAPPPTLPARPRREAAHPRAAGG